MGQLCGQRGGDGVEVELLAAIVDGHLPPFAMPQPVPITLQSAGYSVFTLNKLNSQTVKNL